MLEEGGGRGKTRGARMMIWADRAFVAFLTLGAVGHFLGSLTLLEPGSALQVWSLSGVLCVALIVAINALRWRRPGDVALAWIGGLGALAWVGVVIGFGASLHNFADFRVVWHGAAAAGVAFFALRAALRVG